MYIYVYWCIYKDEAQVRVGVFEKRDAVVKMFMRSMCVCVYLCIYTYTYSDESQVRVRAAEQRDTFVSV